MQTAAVSREIPSPRSTPIGAVLVVGGGIAGMQAALDLADQGFKTYLVETKSAIGGKMAQLDKTFPTNDCAMCTISPKLVETGRHPNIQVMTDTNVLEVRGQAGNFSVRVHHRPRYVDIEKCIACGDCEKVCPVIIPNKFNAGLNSGRAIHKLYPQAVPNAYAIEKRGVAPCRDACPTGQRAQGYIALIREGRWEDALRVIKMDNPFPGICGRICNHRCESACNRGLVDEPVNIRALKRFVTDRVYAQERQPGEPALRRHQQSIAVIGAGPCGLTAAQDLALAGFGVTVFEAMPVAGGMLRLGVPEFRLPTEIIEREIQDILDLGVELRLNYRVQDLDEIFDLGFNAVLIAVGAHEGIRLPIPGADLKGVLVNTHFLRDVRLGKYAAGADEFIGPSRDILVLGGGNVAIDCARSAVRLGCRVQLACLESREAMPAHPWEVQAAEDEGVILHTGQSFERLLGDDNGRVRGLECMQVASFEFDERNRLQVEKIPGSQQIIPCETVIFSVGQRAGLAFIPEDANVGMTSLQTIAVNPNTLATSRPGVFAAGDCISGTAFVVEAVERGHLVAGSIERYLLGEPLEPPPAPQLPVVHLDKQELQARLAVGEIKHQPRVPLPELDIVDRLDNFQEVEGSYDEASAQAEAARCLACGVCSECMSCVFACGVNAIDHDMVAVDETIQVGAVILAPGYQTFQAEMAEEFGFGRYPNVLTSLQFERLLSASGPTFGHVQRPSDAQTPQRIAFLQCIGSRDQTHDYCSAVCCMYASKEAVIAKEHHPGLDIHVFMMDMRAFSKGYWQYFERAKNEYGINYHHSRVSSLHEDPHTNNLHLAYVNEAGQRLAAEFDMVVLSVGMEISPQVQQLGSRLGVELDQYGFCHTVQFNPVETSRAGIYAVGPFREPKDIPESVVEASGAAAAAAGLLSPARFSLTTTPEYVPERDISGEPARVGVFVCHCGSNIAGFVDVQSVTTRAAELPGVVHAESNLYTCSQDSIRHITQTVAELGLNRVVVASCTPLTHAPLFQDSLRQAGLNPYLFEMANIRNQCSWVHSNDKQAATIKARQLVGMAVARAAQLQPETTLQVPVHQTALVIGGGPAGMTAALSLAEQGFGVHLVEKEAELGGNLRFVRTILPGSNGFARQPDQILHELRERVTNEANISLHLQSTVTGSSGFMGNFTSQIKQDDQLYAINHGVTILATGGQEYRGPEFGFGSSEKILSQQQLEQVIAERPEQIKSLKSVAMIQCVGPAERYCSRICCTVAIKNALALKDLNPDLAITIFYKDIRVYGLKENIYTQARAQGVLFVRYQDANPPIVSNNPLSIRARDLALNRTLETSPDLLVLSMPLVPSADIQQLASIFKVPVDAEGFLLEAHVKLRPVDFATSGVYMAGAAHFPKLLDESLIQAQAAASRSARVLSQDFLTAGGQVAVVNESLCTGCLTCVRICPFEVPQIDFTRTGTGGLAGAAVIEPAVCQGCGTCAAECPARAIELRHYTDVQIMAKVQALLQPDIRGTSQAQPQEG